MADSGDYLAFNRRGELCGFWIRRESDATAATLRARATLAHADGHLTADQKTNMYAHAVAGAFRALPNTLDDRGGYILILTD